MIPDLFTYGLTDRNSCINDLIFQLVQGNLMCDERKYRDLLVKRVKLLDPL